jgi:osmotically-inducible protein OsmY
MDVELDDATLVDKVESIVFRDHDVPKGQININAENGVVFLRGQVERPELVETLEKRVRKVGGVKDVENLLHTAEYPSAS